MTHCYRWLVSRARLNEGDTGEEDATSAPNTNFRHDARLIDKDQPAVFLVLYIAKPWLDELRASSGRPFLFPSPRVPISPALREACWRLLDLILEPGEDAKTRIDKEIEGLISTAIDATLAPVNPDSIKRRTQMLDHRLRAAVSYMREHVADPISVDDVAGKVGLSRAHF